MILSIEAFKKLFPVSRTNIVPPLLFTIKGPIHFLASISRYMRTSRLCTILLSETAGVERNKAVLILSVATALSISACGTFMAFIIATCFCCAFGLMRALKQFQVPRE